MLRIYPFQKARCLILHAVSAEHVLFVRQAPGEGVPARLPNRRKRACGVWWSCGVLHRVVQGFWRGECRARVPPGGGDVWLDHPRPLSLPHITKHLKCIWSMAEFGSVSSLFFRCVPGCVPGEPRQHNPSLPLPRPAGDWVMTPWLLLKPPARLTHTQAHPLVAPPAHTNGAIHACMPLYSDLSLLLAGWFGSLAPGLVQTLAEPLPDQSRARRDPPGRV